MSDTTVKIILLVLVLIFAFTTGFFHGQVQTARRDALYSMKFIETYRSRFSNQEIQMFVEGLKN